MIPKVIHYCWISEDMPADIQKCIESWHKYLPDYQFINWNDNTFDWNICNFTKYNREHNNFAFCADFIRFWALYNYGGIYLDSDVMVYKSFDELLKLKRILTKELFFQDVNNPDAAILGCEKGDFLFKLIVDYYTNCDEQWNNKKFQLAPDIMKRCWNVFPKISLDNIDNELPGVINYLNPNKYFWQESPEAFCQHQFKGSWTENPAENILNNTNFKYFLCSHKPITNYIPPSKKYVILDVSGTVRNTEHEVINISQDPFTATHNVCYSEGCAMKWLYEHPEIIPDYIAFGHYRRIFLDFANGKEQLIPRYIERYGAIVVTPFDHSKSERKYNKGGMYLDHLKDDTDAFIESVKEAAPEYWDTFQELLEGHFQYPFNCFATKKEHFLEMCEMCFRVLSHFDKKIHCFNNHDLNLRMIRASKKYSLPYGLNWQNRLQGFWLEWLTQLYFMQKFGIENCYTSNCWIPKDPNTINNSKLYYAPPPKSSYLNETNTYYRQWANRSNTSLQTSPSWRQSYSFGKKTSYRRKHLY